MKKSVSIRVITVIILSVVIGGGALSFYALKKLQKHLNSSGFKSEMETEISKAINGEVHIESIQGRLGWQPWVSVHQLSLKFPENVMELKTPFVRVDIEIWPLLRDELIFSEIHISQPQIVFRRLKGKDWPSFAELFPEKSSSSSLKLRIESISVDQGELTVIDQNRTPEILGVLKANISASRSMMTHRHSVNLTGKVRAMGLEGALKVEGQIFPQVNFRAGLRDIVFSESKKLVPVGVSAVFISTGSLMITADWNSVLTRVTATAKAEPWNTGNYDLQLNGSRINVPEILKTINSLPSETSTGSVDSSSSSWAVHAHWNLKNISLSSSTIPAFQGQSTIQPNGGTVPHFFAEILGGSVNGSGAWKGDPKSSSAMLISVKAKGQQFLVEKLVAIMDSQIPWAGAFNFDLSLTDFPLRNDFSSGWLLRSLSNSREATVNMLGDASFKGKAPLKNIVGKLELDPRSQKLKADLAFDWNEGGVKFEASLPHLVGNKRSDTLEASMKISNLDLNYLPALMKKCELSRAKVDLDVHWWANSHASNILDVYSPDVDWSVNAHLNQIEWRKIPFDDVSGHVVWTHSELQIKDVHGQVAEGSFVVDGLLSNRTDVGFSTFSVIGKTTNIEAAPFMQTVSTNPILIGGRVSSTVRIAGKLNPSDSKSLKGVITIDARNGSVRTGSFMLELFTRLNLKTLFGQNKDRRKGFPFDVVTATCTVGNGHVVFEHPFALKNAELEMAFTGWAATDILNAKGVLVVNPLVGTSNLLSVIPGVSTLILGPNGELLPLIVDVNYKDGKLETSFRSIKTLAAPAVNIIGNVIRLPATLFGRGKKHSSPTSP